MPSFLLFSIYFYSQGLWVPENIQSTSFLIPKGNIFPEGQLQLDHNSNACTSWPYHLLDCAICSDICITGSPASLLAFFEELMMWMEIIRVHVFVSVLWRQHYMCWGCYSSMCVCPSEFINERWFEWMKQNSFCSCQRMSSKGSSHLSYSFPIPHLRIHIPIQK